MNNFIVKTREVKGQGILDGTQKLYRFANNYGASVVRNGASYGNADGLWELAVVKFSSKSDDSWQLTYDTSVTDDVLGFLTEKDVEERLIEIKKLKKGGSMKNKILAVVATVLSSFIILIAYLNREKDEKIAKKFDDLKEENENSDV